VLQSTTTWLPDCVDQPEPVEAAASSSRVKLFGTNRAGGFLSRGNDLTLSTAFVHFVALHLLFDATENEQSEVTRHRRCDETEYSYCFDIISLVSARCRASSENCALQDC
jgi:hypothetical protein